MKKYRRPRSPGVKIHYNKEKYNRCYKCGVPGKWKANSANRHHKSDKRRAWIPMTRRKQRVQIILWKPLKSLIAELCKAFFATKGRIWKKSSSRRPQSLLICTVYLKWLVKNLFIIVITTWTQTVITQSGFKTARPGKLWDKTGLILENQSKFESKTGRSEKMWG